MTQTATSCEHVLEFVYRFEHPKYSDYKNFLQKCYISITPVYI